MRTAVEELGDVHLVGLTATPPGELTKDEAELYESLLGPVDFTVPTPAVVRERYLAPYQELAWLTRPLDSEAQWLAEHDLRFRELVTALHDDAPGAVSFPAWVITRMRERGREGADEARVSWPAFQRRHPALARAGARFLASGGLPLPEGVPRGRGTARNRTWRTGSSCSRTTPSAACAATRRRTRPRATTRLRRRYASSASTSRDRAYGAAPRTSTAC